MFVLQEEHDDLITSTSCLSGIGHLAVNAADMVNQSISDMISQGVEI